MNTLQEINYCRGGFKSVIATAVNRNHERVAIKFVEANEDLRFLQMILKDYLNKHVIVLKNVYDVSNCSLNETWNEILREKFGTQNVMALEMQLCSSEC